MKNVKSLLYSAGLLTPARHLYANLRTASPSVLRREARCRLSGTLPDGHPVPPPSLIFDVIGVRWGAVYYDSGQFVIDDMRRFLAKNGLSLAGFSSILDFGCGSGRLLRHVAPHTEGAFHGTDYNPVLVEWSRAHLPFGTFRANDLRPPLRYEDDAFDFVYARSVFTHFPEALQVAWMTEIRRVLEPGGVFYFTTHGERLSGNRSEEQRRKLAAGEVVTIYEGHAGENLCASFQRASQVGKMAASAGFDLLDHEEGKDEPHLRQDVYLCRLGA